MLLSLGVLGQVAEVDPLSVFQLFAKAVLAGSVPATTLLVLVVIALVTALRAWGPELHRLLPDHTLVDKALAFVFDSSPGKWLLNALSTSGAGFLVYLGADPSQPLTWAVAGPILGGAFTVAGVYQFIRDVFFPPKPAPVSPLVAVPDPDKTPST